MKNKLAEIRTDKFLTQKELAEKSGLSKVTISQIENWHTTPSLLTKKKIAKALGLNVTDIFPESKK